MLSTFIDMGAAFLIANNLESFWGRLALVMISGAGISIAFVLGMAHVDLEPAAYALKGVSGGIIRNSAFCGLCTWLFAWLRTKV